MIQHWHPPTPKEHLPLPGGLQAGTAVAFEQGEAGEGPLQPLEEGILG